MTESTHKPSSLYRKLAAVAGAIGAVEKDGRNADQKYRYPTPASVFLGVKPLLDQQQLAIVPHLVDFAEIDSGQKSGGGKPFVLNRVTMHYHIVDGESGEEMVVPWMAQAGTYGDDKGLAKAQTIALRTFLIQLFQIPAEDPEIDPDARDSRPQNERQPAQQRPAARQAPAPRQTATNGASYEPPAEPPKQTPMRARMLGRITELTAQADQLDLEIELLTPLDQMTDTELIAHGTNLAAAIQEAQQPGRVPSEQLPALTTTA
jgi:hypothetical protein